MVYLFATLLTLVNIVCWASILLNLPGTWLMILVTAVLKWWQPAYVLVSWTVLGVAVGLAALGEVLEFVLGAAGARYAGGSKRAAILALVGGLFGGIVGIAFPVPVVGSLIGACLGAFIGSLIGDVWIGRPIFQSLGAGWGAAVGRFWGTVSKLAVGGVIVVLLSLAAFF